MHTLRLGVAAVDITPGMPVPLAGFGSRAGKGPATGVSQPLTARVFFFEQDTLEGSPRRALLVAADLLWWGPEQVQRLMLELQSRWGLAPDAIILNASHTHSGPQTSTRFVSLIGDPDLDYIATLDQRLLAAVDQASRDLEPVVIERGSSVCMIGIYRRRDADEAAGLPPDTADDPHGPRDTEVVVVRFRRADGRPKALLVHYACHPVTTEDNLLSSEFPGVAMRLLEQADNGLIAAFLQGCCGDINPDLGDGVVRRRGDDHDVRRLGATLAQVVQDVLQQPMELVPPTILRGTSITLDLPMQTLPTREQLEALVDAPGVEGQWSRLLLAAPERVRPVTPFRLSRLDIGEKLALLAMDAEVTVAYGLLIKAKSGGRVLPVPYSNGMIGYVTTARQIMAGGYEPKDSCPYFGMPAPFDPALEQQIQRALLQLLDSRPTM